MKSYTSRIFSNKLFLLILSLLLIISCSKEKHPTGIADISSGISTSESNEKITHTWFYFTNDSFLKTTAPEDVMEVTFKPWTQAVRISSSLQSNDQGYFTVNGVGLLVCTNNSSTPMFITDKSVFSGLTTDHLCFNDGVPVFHTYYNDFFDSEAKFLNNPILYQFSNATNIFYPLLNNQILGLPDETTVTNILKNNKTWTLELKKNDSGRKIYEYISFDTLEPLSSKLVLTRPISTSSYRELCTPKTFSSAPVRLKELLGKVPSQFNFYVTSTNLTGNSPATYLHQTENDTSENFPMQCKALLHDNFSIAIFTDGTSFFAGALPNKYIINNGESLAFRLPKLPENFSYTDFVVINNTLYVAWEESDFFQIARSGFLIVDLQGILY